MLSTTMVFAISYPLFQTSNRILEDSYYAFDTGDYGTAFRLAEEAKLMRRLEVDDCLNLFIQAMKPQAVQKAGDSISEVLIILREREVFDAVELIEYLIDLKGVSFFDNSVEKIKNYIEDKRIFPEVSYIMAKIYEFEGEYDLAYSYYLDAWNNAQVLDIPDEKYDILYDMATLSYNFTNLEDCEKTLLLILSEDSYFSDNSYSSALISNVERGYSIEKIFSLYRTDCYRTIPAFFRLTELYLEQGKSEEAFKTAIFGVLTAFTRIDHILFSRVTEYQYDSLTDFFELAMKYDDILNWSIDNGFWRCFYRLAELGIDIYPENKEFGYSIMSIIAESAPEHYWRQLCIAKINQHN